MNGADVESEPGAPSLSKEAFAYTGRELEAMSEASNYHRWILGIFAPYLGRHLVEVGAGLGSFSDLILSQHDCETLALVEPSGEMYQQLDAHVRKMPKSPRVDAYHANFLEAAPLIKARHSPDSVIYVNVLEHIVDDDAELDAIHRTLSDRGRIFLFVPALEWLFGPFDERVGHLRRYTKSGLEEKLQRAGFQTILSSYFDLAGVAPWWIKYRLLRSTKMEPGGVRFYDRYVVPAARRFEAVIHPPLGKNVIVVAEKGSLSPNLWRTESSPVFR
jgi:SAM-dependent methyltransferase